MASLVCDVVVIIVVVVVVSLMEGVVTVVVVKVIVSWRLFRLTTVTIPATHVATNNRNQIMIL